MTHMFESTNGSFKLQLHHEPTCVPFLRAGYGDRPTQSASTPSTPWSTMETYRGSRPAGAPGRKPQWEPSAVALDGATLLWWAKPPGNGMRRRVPHGHRTRPNTKQSTAFIIIFSDRHSLGWARGAERRAVGWRASAVARQKPSGEQPHLQTSHASMAVSHAG